MVLIEASNLSKKFDQTEVVKSINFSIKKGACSALLGPNGAGKSTTLNMLTGLMKPSSGRISFEEKELNEVDRRFNIGFLPQYPKFYGWMSGIEYLIYVGELSGLSKKQAQKKGEELLLLVGLAETKKKRISGYSGGMKQRLGIAQALVHEPKLLILDEPVSALDPIGRKEVLDLMRELKKTTSILFSTHVLYDAEVISDEVFMMKNGSIILSGEINEIKNAHQKPVIIIETEIEANEWALKLKDYDWVESFEIESGKIIIKVRDLVKARATILSDPTWKALSPTRFEIERTSLEDLFLKVMTS